MTLGGKTKQNGIAHGKIIFQPIGKKFFFQMNERGEKHIADVRTSHGLVIEFQHSHIDPEERTARENFYKNMVWVVDGTRLKRDYHRFLKGKKIFVNTKKQGYYFVDFPEECFPSAWLGSLVPVIFDFQRNGIIRRP